MGTGRALCSCMVCCEAGLLVWYQHVLFCIGRDMDTCCVVCRCRRAALCAGAVVLGRRYEVQLLPKLQAWEASGTSSKHQWCPLKKIKGMCPIPEDLLKGVGVFNFFGDCVLIEVSERSLVGWSVGWLVGWSVGWWHQLLVRRLQSHPHCSCGARNNLLNLPPAANRRNCTAVTHAPTPGTAGPGHGPGDY